MKKFLLLILVAAASFTALAREPYGDYICRYIVLDNGNYFHPVYNPIKITHQGIQAKNTNAGTKTWEARYQGPIRLTNQGGSERFHNFYLVNQNVEFSISDRPVVPYNGKNYYLINFDGQWQLAE